MTFDLLLWEPTRRFHRKNLGAVSCVILLLLFVVFTSTGLQAAEGLTVAWTNNMLSVKGPKLPGGQIEVWYLEAFCRSGSTHRDWHQTTIRQQTELLEAPVNGKRLRLRTRVEPNVEVVHVIRAGSDEVDFRLELQNKSPSEVDVQWFQPCMRVDRKSTRLNSSHIPLSRMPSSA